MTARCTTRGCPVRYRGGDDRACVEHAADDREHRGMADPLASLMAAPRTDDGQAAAVSIEHGDDDQR